MSMPQSPRATHKMLAPRFLRGLTARNPLDYRSLIVLSSLMLASCNDVDVQPQNSDEALCQEYYEACINTVFVEPVFAAIMDTHITCAAEGCHNIRSGSGGAFKIFPDAVGGSDDMTANYFSASAFTNTADPATSKLLLEPLAGTFSIVGSHTGGDIFADPSDEHYQEIYFWISNPQASGTESCPQLDHFPNDPSRRCFRDGTN